MPACFASVVNTIVPVRPTASVRATAPAYTTVRACVHDYGCAYRGTLACTAARVSTTVPLWTTTATSTTPRPRRALRSISFRRAALPSSSDCALDFARHLRWVFARPRRLGWKRLDGEGGGLCGGGCPGAWGELSNDSNWSL